MRIILIKYLHIYYEGGLVAMEIKDSNLVEKMLDLREELISVEEERMTGRDGCTLDELDDYLEGILEEI